MSEITIKADNMKQAAIAGYTTATDLADYLVRKGIAFRDAHEIVGKAVRYCIEQNTELADLELRQLQQFSDSIGEDIIEVLSLQGSLSSRNHIGGTAPEQVRAAVQRARASLDS
jgi:argininosuccinate lyase